MAVTKQDLIDSANQIISESEKGGNTASRVGGLFLSFISFIAAIEGKIVDIPEYDDSEIRKAVENLKDAVDSLNQIVSDTKDLAASERERLQQLLDTLDSTINSNVNDMFNSAAWLEQFAKVIKQTVNEGEIAYQSGWDANIEAYLQQAGVWARNGDTTKTQWSTFKQSVDELSTQVAAVTEDLNGKVTKTQWSEISQKVDGIESSVNALINQGDVSVALKTAINQYVKDGIAGMNLESTYAKKDTENSKEILEWMYSAFKNESSKDLSFAQMVAAGKDATSSGISEIKAASQMVMDGDVLKKVQSTTLANKIADSISELYSKATEDSAENNLFTQVKKTAGEVTTLNTAGLVTKSNINEATAALFAESERTMGDKIVTATAGLVSEASVNNTIATAKNSLTASIDTAIAGVTTRVEKTEEQVTAHTDLLSTIGDSVAGITADVKNIKDNYKEAVVNIFADAGEDAKKARIQLFSAINEDSKDTESKISLSADVIEMTNAFANSITANKAFVGYLEGGNATFKGHIIAQSLSLGDDVSINQDNISGLETTLGNIDTKFDEYYTASYIDGHFAETSYVDGKISTNNVSDELDKALKGKGYIKASDVSVTQETTSEGYKIEKISVGGKDFTTITEPGDAFVLTNVGMGTDSASSKGYFMVDTNGLLKARNALIYGTVYANAGRFSGEITASSGTIGGFTISETLLHTANKANGIGNDPYFYVTDTTDPLMMWAGYNTPTETWSNTISSYDQGYSKDTLWAKAYFNYDNGTTTSYADSDPIPLTYPTTTFAPITCWYALQDSTVSTAPTSGWTAFSYYYSTIYMTSNTKKARAGKHYWIRIDTALQDFKYIHLKADAALINNFRIQYVESSVGDPTFYVTKGGIMNASSGKVGGFLISDSKMTSLDGTAGFSSTGTGTYLSNVRLWAGGSSSSSAPFRVLNNGTLYATQGKIGGLEITDSGSLSYTEANLFGLKCTFATSGTTYTMSNTQSYIEVYSGSSITTVTLPTNPLAGSFVIVHNQRTTAITISNSTNFVGESYKSFSLGAGRCFVGVFLRAYGTSSPLINTTCWKISS